MAADHAERRGVGSNSSGGGTTTLHHIGEQVRPPQRARRVAHQQTTADGRRPLKPWTATCERPAEAFEALYRLQLRGIRDIAVTGPDGENYDADDLLQTSRAGGI